MYLCNLTREDIVSLLPGGGEVAEIGVAEGTFSREILARSKPRRLHLIDPWTFQERSDYAADRYGNVPAEAQDARYRAVKSAFASSIDSGQVILDRSYSTSAASRFENHQFDWIYVDALHSQEAVAADLLAFKDKVKPDGFILGHDYTNHSPALNAGFGVIEAVNQFVIEHGYSLLLVTMENFPTYVLTKAPDSEVARQFLLKVLYSAPSTVELKGYPASQHFKHHAVQIGDRSVVYYSFGVGATDTVASLMHPRSTEAA